MFLKVFFSLWLLLSSFSYAQTELNNPACVLELSELSPDTPKALANFNLPNHLKIPLIDLTRLRIKLTQSSERTSLMDHYSSELKKLKEAFLAQGYTEVFFDETRALFFLELSQIEETLEQEIKVKTTLIQKQKNEIYPLRGRTRQVIDAIVSALRIPEKDVTIEDLEKITELDLSSKEITELREHDFKGLIHLKTLFLNNNQLVELPETVFQGLGFLKLLCLDYNRFTELPENVFLGLGSLVGLHLTGNQLAGLPKNLFWGLGSLVFINLGSNPIPVISGSVFSVTGSNSSIKIGLEGIPIDPHSKKLFKKSHHTADFYEFRKIDF